MKNISNPGQIITFLPKKNNVFFSIRYFVSNFKLFYCQLDVEVTTQPRSLAVCSHGADLKSTNILFVFLENEHSFRQFSGNTLNSLINKHARLAFLDFSSTIFYIIHVTNEKIFHHTCTFLGNKWKRIFSPYSFIREFRLKCSTKGVRL